MTEGVSEMKLFDKKFVYFMWDEELEGKEGFFADEICHLIDYVVDGYIKHASVKESTNAAYPFTDTTGHDYKFFYYDSNYDWKRAYVEGKQLQFKFMGNDYGEWFPVLPTHNWDNDNTIYRIKPEEPKPKRMTYRQLAEWVGTGNGEQTTPLSGSAMVMVSYDIVCENKEVPDTCKIRRWGSDEWIEPTLDVYKNDCKEVSE